MNIGPVGDYYWTVLGSLRRMFRVVYGLDPLGPVDVHLGSVNLLFNLDENPVWSPDWSLPDEVLAQVVISNDQLNRMQLDASAAAVSHPLAERAQKLIDDVDQCYQAVALDLVVDDCGERAPQEEFDHHFHALAAALEKLEKYRLIGETPVPGPAPAVPAPAAPKSKDAKLSPSEQLNQDQTMYAKVFTHKRSRADVAREYGVAKSTVSRAVKREKERRGENERLRENIRRRKGNG